MAGFGLRANQAERPGRVDSRQAETCPISAVPNRLSDFQKAVGRVSVGQRQKGVARSLSAFTQSCPEQTVMNGLQATPVKHKPLSVMLASFGIYYRMYLRSIQIWHVRRSLTLNLELIAP